MRTPYLYVTLTCILICNNLSGRSKPNQGKDARSCHIQCTQLEKGPITIFIHGTIFPIISRVVHRHKVKRRGLYRYSSSMVKPGTSAQNLGSALHSSAPDTFPEDGFYKFYWSGKLSQDERKKAAYELFSLLKDHSGPITIIAHSHGCSIALYLAELAHPNT